MNAATAQSYQQPDLRIVKPDEPEPVHNQQEEQAEEFLCIHPDAKLTDETRVKGVIRNLMKRYKEYRDHPERQRYERYWDLSERAYMGILPSMVQDQTVVIREVLRQIETLKPQVSKALTWGDILFTIKARLEGAEQMADGATAIIHDQLSRFGSRQQIQSWVDEWCFLGTSYIVYGWRRYKQTKFKCQSMHAPDTETYWDRQSYEVQQEAPYAQHISCWDIITDPFMEEAKNSPAVYHVRGFSGDDLKTLVREGFLDAKATKAAMEHCTGSVYHGHDAQHHWDDLDYLDNIENTFEGIRCMTIDGWEYFVLNGEYILRAMPLEDGVIPVETLRLMPRTGRHFGMPMPMVIMGEQNFLNEVMALIVKGMRFSLVPLVYGKQAAIDAWNAALIKPGTGIAVTNMSDLAALEMPNKVPDILGLKGSCQNDMARGAGLPDVVAGLGTSGANTATGQLSLRDSASDRLNHIVQTGKPAFTALYNAFYRLNARNQNKVYNLRIAGPEGNFPGHYTPEVFMPEIDVEIHVGGPQGMQAANLLLNISKNFMSWPGANIEKLYLATIEAAGLPKPTSFLAKPEIDAVRAAMLAIQQWDVTGIIADAKPTDNHMLMLQVFNMYRQTMEFGLHPDEWIGRFEARVQQHLLYQQQMMGMTQQMGMAPASEPDPGASPAGQIGNENANAMMDMGGMGADQMGMGG